MLKKNHVSLCYGVFKLTIPCPLPLEVLHAIKNCPLALERKVYWRCTTEQCHSGDIKNQIRKKHVNGHFWWMLRWWHTDLAQNHFVVVHKKITSTLKYVIWCKVKMTTTTTNTINLQEIFLFWYITNILCIAIVREIILIDLRNIVHNFYVWVGIWIFRYINRPKYHERF